MSTLKRTEAYVDLDCAAHNFREIRRFTNNAGIICVIKADAYGHGAVKLAKLYESLGADILAVACLDEALELRRSGVTAPIMILGATPAAFANFLCDNNIIQSVHSLSYAKELSVALGDLGGSIKIHIKLDTGMSRFGINAHEYNISRAVEDCCEIAALPGLVADGIFTHFAEAESSDTTFTDKQFENFSFVVESLKNKGVTFNFCHCANSAAVVNYKKAHLNCVRPGLLLYGYSPTDAMPEGLDLKTVLTFRSLVADIHSIMPGDSVSYNRTFTAERKMKVAVVSCGYADGVHRSLSRKGAFLINGKRAPILGNICMDLTMVDVTDIPDVKPFDEAVIFGNQQGVFLSAKEQADLAGTIPYELLTSVSKRVLRTYSDGDA